MNQFVYCARSVGWNINVLGECGDSLEYSDCSVRFQTISIDILSEQMRTGASLRRTNTGLGQCVVSETF